MYKRILVANLLIGLVVVPVYILLKHEPFLVVFLSGIVVTFAVLLLFFYFLGARFVGMWAVLQKLLVTLPTSFILSLIAKELSHDVIEEYLMLLVIGYSVSTPLIFLTYKIAKKMIKKLT